jgi:hypothetical protein
VIEDATKAAATGPIDLAGGLGQIEYRRIRNKVLKWTQMKAGRVTTNRISPMAKSGKCGSA